MSRARDVVEVIAKALAARPDEVEVTEYDAPRPDGRGADDGAGRTGTGDRPAGSDGRGGANARGGGRRAGRSESRGRFSGRVRSRRVDWASMVTVGRIVRPHGNRGHVVVVPESDFAEDRFRAGEILRVTTRR